MPVSWSCGTRPIRLPILSGVWACDRFSPERSRLTDPSLTPHSGSVLAHLPPR
jgi:hypothetical protein